MIQDWFAKDIFIYILIGICGIGMLVKFAISMKYRTLICASKKMGSSKNKFMCELRQKFEACYKLNLGVNNVDNFVDKYVYRQKFCGILLYTWETISGEIIILSILSTLVFGLLGAWKNCGQTQILSTVAVGILATVVLIAYDYFVNIKTKKKILKINILDYLENFLNQSLEKNKKELNMEELEQYKKEVMQTSKKKKEKNPEQTAAAESAATEEKGKKGKNDSKPKDEGLLRREAKKNELKKMIEEDKKKRKDDTAQEQKGLKEELTVSSEKQEMNNVTEFPSNKANKEKEHTEQKVVEKEEEEEKETLENQQEQNAQLEISPEEAKIIEDILKEYLA